MRAFAALALLFVVPAAAGTWHDDASPLRRRIDVAAVAGAAGLVDFPVRVELPAAPTGARFFASDGTALAFERESATAFWVRLPDLASAFWVYLGNPADAARPTEVWSNHFRAVWHLDRLPANDSSRYAHHTTAEGGLQASAVQPGVAGGAIAFDGVDDQLSAALPATLEFSSAITLETWVRLDRPRAQQDVFARFINKWYGDMGGWILSLEPNVPDGVMMGTADGTKQDHAIASVPMSVGRWIHIAGTWAPAPGRNRVYADGKLVLDEASVNTFIQAQPQAVQLGGDRMLAGALDEARISDVARSPEWIAAQHLSMKGQLLTLGPEESPATLAAPEPRHLAVGCTSVGGAPWACLLLVCLRRRGLSA